MSGVGTDSVGKESSRKGETTGSIDERWETVGDERWETVGDGGKGDGGMGDGGETTVSPSDGRRWEDTLVLDGGCPDAAPLPSW